MFLRKNSFHKSNHPDRQPWRLLISAAISKYQLILYLDAASGVVIGESVNFWPRILLALLGTPIPGKDLKSVPNTEAFEDAKDIIGIDWV